MKGTTVGQREHLQNFISAVRAGDSAQLNQPITEGHQSTLLCLLGNISYRTGQVVVSDPKTGRILDSEDQQALWRREYSPQWEAEIVNV